MKILLLGSNHSNTARAYQQFGFDKSTLVDSIDQDYQIGHTARQEFNSDKELEQVLLTADRIYWVFPDVTEFTSSHEYYVMLEWIKQYNSKYGNICNLQDIKVDPYHWNVDTPSLTADDAVFFGCSFTKGVGISIEEQKWTNLVSQHFGKNCVNLGRSGSSNQYSFDLISNVELTPGQIVIWQLTHLDRFVYCDEDFQLQHIILAESNHSKHRSMIDMFTRQQMMYELRSKVNMVVKTCRAAKAKFVFWPIDYKELSTFSFTDLLYFYHLPEFIPAYKLQDYMVDAGADKIHPGPKSNKIIAQTVIEHLEALYQ